MSSSDPSKELTSLLKKLRAAHAQAASPTEPSSKLDPAEPLLTTYVRSFLLWDAPSSKADAALKKLEQTLVDFNELRVCLPDELVAIIGERYPRAGERALRLRSALCALYLREHAVTLEPLATLDPAKAREYVLSLDGTPDFVAARVCLVALSHHAAPVDQRILHRLIESKVVDKAASVADAAQVLERLVAPGEMLETYTLLQAWADAGEFSIPGVDPPRVSVRPANPPEPIPQGHRRVPGKSAKVKPRSSSKPASKPASDAKKRTKAEK